MNDSILASPAVYVQCSNLVKELVPIEQYDMIICTGTGMPFVVLSQNACIFQGGGGEGGRGVACFLV